jgi:hypothetical protein
MGEFVAHHSVTAKQKCAGDDVKPPSRQDTDALPFLPLNLSASFAFLPSVIGIFVKS